MEGAGKTRTLSGPPSTRVDNHPLVTRARLSAEDRRDSRRRGNFMGNLESFVKSSQVLNL